MKTLNYEPNATGLDEASLFNLPDPDASWRHSVRVPEPGPSSLAPVGSHSGSVIYGSHHALGEFLTSAKEFSVGSWVRRFRAALVRFRSVPPSWDGEGANRPTRQAIQAAASFLELISEAGLRPSRIAPDVEGGILLSFTVGTKKALLQFTPEGAVTATTISSPQVRTWEVGDRATDIRATFEAIGDSLGVPVAMWVHGA